MCIAMTSIQIYSKKLYIYFVEKKNSFRKMDLKKAMKHFHLQANLICLLSPHYRTSTTHLPICSTAQRPLTPALQQVNHRLNTRQTGWLEEQGALFLSSRFLRDAPELNTNSQLLQQELYIPLCIGL